MAKDSVDRSIENIIGGAAQLALVAGVLGLAYMWRRNQPTPEEKLLELYGNQESTWGSYYKDAIICAYCHEEFNAGFSDCPYCEKPIEDTEPETNKIQTNTGESSTKWMVYNVLILGFGLWLPFIAGRLTSYAFTYFSLPILFTGIPIAFWLCNIPDWSKPATVHALAFRRSLTVTAKRGATVGFLLFIFTLYRVVFNATAMANIIFICSVVILFFLIFAFGVNREQSQ